MRGSVRHRIPLGTGRGSTCVDPGSQPPPTTQTPRALTAQRGGVGGSVRPGLRPANLGRRMEPFRIRQVIRLAVPVVELRCGLRLRVSAGIGPASPERGCVFSCGREQTTSRGAPSKESVRGVKGGGRASLRCGLMKDVLCSKALVDRGVRWSAGRGDMRVLRVNPWHPPTCRPRKPSPLSPTPSHGSARNGDPCSRPVLLG